MARPIFKLFGTIGDYPNTARMVGAFLDMHAGKPVDIIVNSYGGAAFEGSAILADVEAHGNVRFIVRGIAASSASFILCGGREVVMHEAAMWMGHLPWSMSIGDSDDHRQEAMILDKIAETDVAIYARSSGQPVARVMQWLREETWLTAAEAVALGFADRIEKGTPAEEAARHDYTKHKGAPAALMKLARDNGWVADPPEADNDQEKTDA